MATPSYRVQPSPSIPGQIVTALAGGLALFLSTVVVWTLGYQLLYAGRIFPGVTVAGVDLSGLSPNQATVKLSQTLSYPITGKVLFRQGDQTWVATPAELGMVFDPTASALSAYHLGRAGGLFGALAGQIRARGRGVDVSPVIIFDQRVAYRYLQNIAAQVDQPVVEATLRLEGTNVVSQPGQVGRLLNLDATLVYLAGQLQSFRDGEVPLVIQEAAPAIVDLSAQAEAARQMVSQPLVLSVPNYRAGDPGPWSYDVQVVANMIAVNHVASGGQAEVRVGLDPAALRTILNDLKPFVDRHPVNPRFIFNDTTLQLELLQPSEIGRVMDVEASILAINEALARGEHNVLLAVTEQQPAIADTATAPELGITQNVETYTSYFRGSSAARLQNIEAAARKFHGLLVPPGATFSMGDYMGDISLDNGFAEALIIYGGRTIKGVGGGVCQVSTTLFRTVFYAGFPIAERIPHAYRVSYYEQTAAGIDPGLAGLDATVFFPLVDFKFVNDTPYWLLMETYFSASSYSLMWKFYSTDDGRTVISESSGLTNLADPPAPVIQQNPEFSAGEFKQVEYPIEGADVTVTRTVVNSTGEIRFVDKFVTNYQPWGAVCEYGPGTEDPERLARRAGLCQRRD